MSKTAITKTDFPAAIAWVFRKSPLLLGESGREYEEICKSLIEGLQGFVPMRRSEPCD